MGVQRARGSGRRDAAAAEPGIRNPAAQDPGPGITLCESSRRERKPGKTAGAGLHPELHFRFFYRSHFQPRAQAEQSELQAEKGRQNPSVRQGREIQTAEDTAGSGNTMIGNIPCIRGFPECREAGICGSSSLLFDRRRIPEGNDSSGPHPGNCGLELPPLCSMRNFFFRIGVTFPGKQS